MYLCGAVLIVWSVLGGRSPFGTLDGVPGSRPEAFGCVCAVLDRFSRFESFSAGLEPFWAGLDRFEMIWSRSGRFGLFWAGSSPLGTPGGDPQEVLAKCLGLGSLPLTLKGSTAFTACAKRHALPWRSAAPA